MNIAWGITGAGHLLEETFKKIEKYSNKEKITTFITRSGEEVVKAYGLWEKLERISPGEYMREIFTTDEGYSAPPTGRFFLRQYDLLIVAPATTNTVAKIVHGIADTLVTNAVSHAMKTMTPTYILPVDIKKGVSETRLPYFIDKTICKFCTKCPPQEVCEKKAISNFRIDLLKCSACGLCQRYCEYGAIIGGKKVKIQVRTVDIENVERLRKMEHITVLETPEEIEDIISKFKSTKDLKHPQR
jgi:dihydromethanopterin reductase (acceptor)